MRKLSMRERVLLGCLAVIAVVSGYIRFFYMPMSQRIEELNAQITQDTKLQTQLETKLLQQQKMEQTLNQLSSLDNAPRYMPEYDNLQSVMTELNAILSNCQEYSLSFQGNESKGHVFYRRVTIPFTCTSYAQAKDILNRLHSGALRGLLTDVQVTQDEDGTVSTTAVMVFLEYLPEAVATEPATTEQPDTDQA